MNSKTSSLIIFLVCNHVIPSFSSMYTGSWCPYQIHKSVPCRVQNGTEAYLGPNICWTSTNGSHVCTKRIQYRPRFVITYKKVWETRYKCCPGLEGSECETECFNCSKFHLMENRILEFETKLNKLTPSGNEDGTSHIESQWPITNTIEHPQVFSSHSKNDLLDMEIRFAALSTNFRHLDDRLRSVETQLIQLIRSVDDLSETLTKKVDVAAVNLKDNLERTLSSSSAQLENRINHENSNRATKTKSHPQSYNYNSLNDYSQYSLSTQSLISANANDVDVDSQRSPSSTETVSLSQTEQYTNNNPTKSTIINNNKDILVQTAREEDKTNPRHKQKSSTRSPIPPVKILEENLERGDIASTLNDVEEYDDEEILTKKDFNSEDYSDQLLETGIQLHRDE